MTPSARRTLLAVVPAALFATTGAIALVATPKEHCLARFSTMVENRSRNQKHNAYLAAAKLNGAVIQPGQTFSFNGRVGSFSKDVGYRKAPVSFNGQLINSFGGGVCQTSTTTYNAALRAGLDIVERCRHRFAPNYVPPGMDAAVAYYNIDLKLKNTYPFALRIEAGIKGDRLEVGFYGAGQAKRVQLDTQVRHVRNPGLFELGDRTSAGKVRNTGKPGYFVQVFRTIDGVMEMVSSDNYPVMERVVDRR
jgi:vancomycin resistance protein YoaR